MLASTVVPFLTSAAAGGRSADLEFEAVYEAHFDFVFRSLRRLGVHESFAEDAAQDVFLVVHRRLRDFEGRSSVKTWLFGIAMRVARDYRRRAARSNASERELSEAIADAGGGPVESAERAEAARKLHRLLDQLDEDRRAVFILAEIEEMSMPEIAEALHVNINTLASRLRSARADFEKALARDRRRSR